jgi:hypothetical protein
LEEGELSKVSVVMLRDGRRTVLTPLAAAVEPGEYVVELNLRIEEMPDPLVVEQVVALKR